MNHLTIVQAHCHLNTLFAFRGAFCKLKHFLYSEKKLFRFTGLALKRQELGLVVLKGS